MIIYYTICFFIMGTILGSFYNVVASRLTKGESILFPPSHCSDCNHVLKPWELIPIFSFLLQKGKCSNCKVKLSWFYPISEAICGLLFAISFLVFGISLNLIIALTFVSMLIIIVLSDIYYMIIEDSVLIVFSLLLLLEMYFIHGLHFMLQGLLNGIIAFLIMLALKLMGDYVFKKESMGGGDVKLMFTFGLVISWPMALISIFFASFIALPYSIIVLKIEKGKELPFGPFLSLAALIILFTHLDISMIIELLTF